MTPSPTTHLTIPALTTEKAELARLALMTLRDRYIDTLGSDETKRAYRRDIKAFLGHLALLDGTLGDLEVRGLADLYGSLVEFLQGYLKYDPSGRQVVNQKTYNRVRQSNASFFKYLQLFYLFPWNPAVYVKKLCERDKSNTQDLSEDEVYHMLWRLKKRAPESEKDARDFLLMLGLTLQGVRRGELAAFTWESIAPDGGSITIMQKGGREKVMPLPLGYHRLLIAFGEKYGRPCSFIFRPTKNPRFKDMHRPVSGDTIYRVVRKIASEVVPEKAISPHSFRTTFTTLGLKWNVPALAIKNGGGWASLDMVAFYDRNNPLEFNLINVMAERFHKEKII